MRYTLKTLNKEHMKEMRRKWALGWTGKRLSEWYDVKPGFIYRNCADLPKNHRRGVTPVAIRNINAKPKPVPKARLRRVLEPAGYSISQLKQHMPHFLLYLFCRSEMSDEMVDQMGDQNRSLGKDLRKVSDGLTIDEIVRDHPLLLLRNLIRQERLKPFKRKGEAQVSDGRTMGKWNSVPATCEAVADTDQDLFDAKSDLMRDMAATAIHYALNPPDPKE